MRRRRPWAPPRDLDAEITALIEATRRGEIEPPNPDDFVDPEGRQLAQLLREMVAKATEDEVGAPPGAGAADDEGNDRCLPEPESPEADQSQPEPSQEPPEPEDAPEATTPPSEPAPSRGAVSHHATPQPTEVQNPGHVLSDPAATRAWLKPSREVLERERRMTRRGVGGVPGWMEGDR